MRVFAGRELVPCKCGCGGTVQIIYDAQGFVSHTVRECHDDA